MRVVSLAVVRRLRLPRRAMTKLHFLLPFDLSSPQLVLNTNTSHSHQIRASREDSIILHLHATFFCYATAGCFLLFVFSAQCACDDNVQM